MRLEESIMHAIDGNAVLFLGAGFNSGAINFNDERFPLGNVPKNYRRWKY